MTLYHYCKTESFLAIITTNEIWACEMSLANDAMEGRWIHNLASMYVDSGRMDTNHKMQFLNQIELVCNTTNALALCLSEDGDMLSQWRGYASDGAGVCIGLSEKWLEAIQAKKRFGPDGAFLAKVEYEPKRQMEIMAPFFEALLKHVKTGAFDTHGTGLMSPPKTEQDRSAKASARIDAFKLMAELSLWVHRLKNPAFAEEKEWRLIIPLLAAKRTGVYKEFEFIAKSNYIFPYEALEIRESDPRAIDEVVLGPKHLTPEHLLRAILDRHSFNEVSVRKSSASYR